MKKQINVTDYATEILTAVQKGVLITTCAGGRVNSMTISWGALGIDWGKPVFTTYIRESRFTKELLAQNGEFTVNIPYGDYDKRILSVCGSKSGRDTDKIAELSLTTVPGDTVSVPAIRELPLTLECRVVYTQEQDASALPAFAVEKFYPAGTDGKPDIHTAFYGEVTAAYILE